MIRLTAGTRVLKMRLSSAGTVNELPVVVSYVDKIDTHGQGFPNTQVNVSQGTTEFTICTAPTSFFLGQQFFREIDAITVVNTDTASKRVFIYYQDVDTTNYTIANPLLSPGDQLTYTQEGGWQTLDSTGSVKTKVTPAPNAPVITKVTKTFQDFSIAGLTNDIEIYSLAAGERLIGMTLFGNADFKGGAIATYTLSTGINGNLTKYSAVFNAFAGTGNFQDTGNFYIENWTAATSVRAAAVATGANLSAANSGSIDFYIETIQVKS